MYFLGASELLTVEDLMLNLTFFIQGFNLCPLLEAILYNWGHLFCPLSGVKVYCFYGKINQGHVVCPLYGGGPYLRVHYGRFP